MVAEKFIDSHVPLITIMPKDLKQAMLIPIIKKIILDPEIFNHFRPISNLPFISKIIQKVVASRLNSHMVSNGLHELMQSSYKEFHSTETALTCVLDDLLRAIDDRKNGLYYLCWISVLGLIL